MWQPFFFPAVILACHSRFYNDTTHPYRFFLLMWLVKIEAVQGAANSTVQKKLIKFSFLNAHMVSSSISPQGHQLCDWTMQVQTGRISPRPGSSCHTRPHTRAVFNLNICHFTIIAVAFLFLFSWTLNNTNRMCLNVYEADWLRLTTLTGCLYISLAAHKRCSPWSVSFVCSGFQFISSSVSRISICSLWKYMQLTL